VGTFRQVLVSRVLGCSHSCRVDGTEGYKTSWNEPAYVADANCHAYLRQVVAIILFACANVASVPRYSAGPENMHAASIRKGFIS
jgi:hypothetical protein